MAEAAHYSSGGDFATVKRKNDDSTTLPPPSSARWQTEFSAPIISSQSPPVYETEIAKQRAQEIAARLFNNAEPKRPKLENGGEYDSTDYEQKPYSSTQFRLPQDQPNFDPLYIQNPNLAYCQPQIQQSDESSDETQPVTLPNEDSDESPEEIVPPMHTSTRKKAKAKPWTDKEEEALAKAWLDVSEPETGNQQRSDSFWKRVLDKFEVQLGNTDRTVHQLNSKWKDMNGKINKFNDLYIDKQANRRSGQSDADILVATIIEYRKLYKNKAFPHQTTWEIVKDNPKWNAVPLVGVHGQSAKRTKAPDSNTYTTSSDTQFPNEEDERFHYEEAQRPQRKEKKPASSLVSSEQQLLKIVSEFNSFNKEDIEDKKQYRAGKLRLMKEEKEKKMLILEQELRMMRQKEMDNDMQFFITPHDSLIGGALNAVLARKREIAQRWGWE